VALERGVMISSTPAFLVASALSGLALYALVKILAPPVNALYRRWQTHRLEQRYAQGSYQNFDDSQPAGIALPDSSSAPRPTTILARLAMLFNLWFFGALVLTWFVSKDDRPVWTELLLQTIFILVGVQWLTGVVNWSDRPTVASRLTGVAMIAVFASFLIHDISRLP
jgi:hypothetical protein